MNAVATPANDNQVLDPRQRDASMKSLLISAQKQIQSICAGNEKEAAKFMAIALMVAKSDALSSCTPYSIVQAMLQVVSSGLNPEPSVGHVYFIPYGEKNSQNKTVQLQIGWKGYKQLAWDAGWNVNAKLIFTCDTFDEVSDGFTDSIIYKKNPIAYENEGEPNWVYDNLRCVLVTAEHVQTKVRQSFTISKSVVEKHRRLSPNQKDKQRPYGNFWLPFYGEMALKTGVRRMVKNLPYHTRLDAIEKVEEKVVESVPVRQLPSTLASVPAQFPQQQRQSQQQPKQLENSPSETMDFSQQDVPNYDSYVDAETGEINEQAEAKAKAKAAPIETDKANSPESVEKLLRSAKTKKNLDAMIAGLSDSEKSENQDVIDECLDLFR